MVRIHITRTRPVKSDRNNLKRIYDLGVSFQVLLFKVARTGFNFDFILIFEIHNQVAIVAHV